MNYKVKTIVVFEKSAKSLIKKYPSLKAELSTLVQLLKQNPVQGVR
jgi:mRNA-degrading endonuclease YafQ of YafQ-DinJ toxin-antitoxin module